MTLDRATRHGVVLALATALAACASKQATPLAGPSGGLQVDQTRCDPAGKQVVSADTNGDKKPDVTRLYEVRDVNGSKTQVLACRQVDLNFDDKVDIVYHYDQSGVISFEEFDLDFDGRFDSWTYYQGGKKVREEMDVNHDRRPDFTKYFEGDRLVRIELDTNHDGKVDQWEYYENGKLDRIGYDTTGSGRADKWDRAPEAEPSGSASNEAASAAAPAAPAPTAPAPPAPPPANNSATQKK
jgi:hypothetical protein